MASSSLPPVDIEAPPGEREPFVPVIKQETGQTWPPPRDVLPNMQEVVKAVNAAVAADATVFTSRGVDARSRNLHLERDLSLLHDVFIELLRGNSYRSSMQLFFHNWYYKPELIQTIEALTAMDNRITSLGDRLSEVIFGETKSFFRTSIQKDAIGSSVSMKVAQLAFLVGYAGIEVNLKALHEPPPPFLKGLVCVLDEETRAGLRLTLPDDAVPSVRPAHADWFVHDVPLMESPLWTWTHTILKTAEANQSNVFAERMSFLRIFLCEMRSHLKSQLDLVNFAQAKIYALVGTAALTLISHYRLQKFAAEFLAEGLFNVTGKW